MSPVGRGLRGVSSEKMLKISEAEQELKDSLFEELRRKVEIIWYEHL